MARPRCEQAQSQRFLVVCTHPQWIGSTLRPSGCDISCAIRTLRRATMLAAWIQQYAPGAFKEKRFAWAFARSLLRTLLLRVPLLSFFPALSLNVVLPVVLEPRLRGLLSLLSGLPR